MIFVFIVKTISNAKAKIAKNILKAGAVGTTEDVITTGRGLARTLTLALAICWRTPHVMGALKTITKGLNGGVKMCEYCYWVDGHHPRCPNATDPKVLGSCEQCNKGLREDYEYYTDNEDNKFCSIDCSLEFHGIKSKEWNCKEGW